MTVDEKMDLLIEQNKQILAFVTPKIMGGSLVSDEQQKPERPTKAQTSANPSLYYKTPDDPIGGPAPHVNVVLKYETPLKDADGYDVHRFIGGSKYAWAKADLPAFLAWYKDSEGFPLNLNALHPDQRSLMGLNG